MDTLTSPARRFVRPAATVVTIGTFLAVLGPFGSATMGWPLVWLYWVGLIALGAVFGYGAAALLPRLFPRWPMLMVYSAAIVIVSIPVTAAVIALGLAMAGGSISLVRVAVTFGLVVVISSFATAVAYAVDQLTARRNAARETSAPAAGAALLDKLPVRLRRATLLAMSAEDHYLRVRTSAGEALILMRLSDAAAACEGLDGARTHRSWWVARDAVRDARKGDGRGVLVLTDGAEVPVSRTYYPALREAGWF